MSTAVLAIRVLLAAVFAVAGVGKLRDLKGSRQAMRDFGVPAGMAGAAGLLLPIAELIAAVALLFPPSARWGAVLALLLLLAFIAGIAAALRRGEAPDCHCFGQIHSEPAGPSTLVRNAVLAALAVFVIAEGPGPSISEWVGDRTAAELVAVATGILALGFGLAWLKLYREHRDIYIQLNRAQRQAMTAEPGVPIGAPAPPFSLRALTGDTVTLESLLERGQPLLLVFVSPSCESCHEILPNLANWQATLPEQLTIVPISTGDTDRNATAFEPYGIEELLLQKTTEVADDYRIRGTPSAVLVTADGRVASTPAETVFGLEPLVRLALREGVSTLAERPAPL